MSLSPSPFLPCLLLLAVSSLASCRKAEISVYVAPKEVEFTPPSSVEAEPDSEPEQARKPQGKLDCQPPATWVERPSDRMNVRQFTAETPSGQVSINVTPLESMAGKEPLLVNMWRGAIGQPEFNEEEALKALLPVAVGSDSGQMFEVTGKRPDGDTSIITAFIHRDGRSWFFKLQGSPAAVAEQKSGFIDFLKTVKISAP